MKNAKKDIIIDKTALILSSAFPGIGQIYKREYMKGFNLIIIQCIFIFFLFYPARMLFPLGVVLVPTLWVLSMADAALPSFPQQSSRLRYLLRRVVVSSVSVWIFAVIVFAITTTVVKHKLNPSKSAVMIVDEEPKLKLLTKGKPMTNSDDNPSDFNAPNVQSIIPVKEFPAPQPEELGTTSSDISSTFADTQPVNAVEYPERPSQIVLANLEEAGAFSYVIITGAFSQYRDAEKLRLQLSQKGYQSLITSVISNNARRVHVVIIPVSSTISVARAITNKLRREVDACREVFIATIDCFIATAEKPIVPADKFR